MERITPAQLIWVMVVNGGHCTRKIPRGGRGGGRRGGGESLEEIRERLALCHRIVVVLRVEPRQAIDNDTGMSSTVVPSGLFPPKKNKKCLRQTFRGNVNRLVCQTFSIFGAASCASERQHLLLWLCFTDAMNCRSHNVSSESKTDTH